MNTTQTSQAQQGEAQEESQRIEAEVKSCFIPGCLNECVCGKETATGYIYSCEEHENALNSNSIKEDSPKQTEYITIKQAKSRYKKEIKHPHLENLPYNTFILQIETEGVKVLAKGETKKIERAKDELRSYGLTIRRIDNIYQIMKGSGLVDSVTYKGLLTFLNNYKEVYL